MEHLTLRDSIRYLYDNLTVIYTYNPLMYILTSAKLDAVGQCWVAALPNYNFQLPLQSW